MNERSQQQPAPIDDAQREAMLGDLVARMKRMHRARRLRGTAAAAACLLLMIVVLGLPAAAIRRTEPVRPLVSQPPPPPAAAGVRIVRTDPAVLDRYTAASSTNAVIINDETLLRELARIDRPAGLIRMGDRVWLTADVVGADRDDRRPPKPPSS